MVVRQYDSIQVEANFGDGYGDAVYRADVMDSEWDIVFCIENTNLAVYSGEIPHYIELFSEMQNYVNTKKEEEGG